MKSNSDTQDNQKVETRNLISCGNALLVVLNRQKVRKELLSHNFWISLLFFMTISRVLCWKQNGSYKIYTRVWLTRLMTNLFIVDFNFLYGWWSTIFKENVVPVISYRKLKFKNWNTQSNVRAHWKNAYNSI